MLLLAQQIVFAEGVLYPAATLVVGHEQEETRKMSLPVALHGLRLDGGLVLQGHGIAVVPDLLLLLQESC